MADKLKVGVIGSGMIGKSHLRQYAEMSEVEVIALADLNGDEASKVADQYGIEKVFADYHDLLAIDEIDSVDVCLPNSLHSPVTVEALEAGKHVYCEKPMARNYAEAKAMMDTSKRVGKHLAVQAGTIFTPECRAAEKIIGEGGLGQLYLAKLSNCRRKGRPWVDGYGTPHFASREIAGGGALLDTGVYVLNRFFHLVNNAQPVSVSASTFQELPVYEQRAGEIDVEELAVALVRLDNGMTLLLDHAWASHIDKTDGDILLGSKGGLRLQPFGYFSDLFGMEANTTFDLKLAEYHQRQFDSNLAGYDSAQKHWVYALLGRAEMIPTAEYALTTALVSDAIYESAAKGEEVKVTG